MNDYKNTIRDILKVHSMNKIESFIFSDDEIDKIIKDFFIIDNINSEKFLKSYEEVLSESSLSFVEDKNPTMPIEQYVFENKYMSSFFPLWFRGAYPDVMNFFRDYQVQCLRFNAYSKDALRDKIIEAFDMNDKEIEGKEILDSNKKYRLKYLRNLIKYYKTFPKGKRIVKKLELSSKKI